MVVNMPAEPARHDVPPHEGKHCLQHKLSKGMEVNLDLMNPLKVTKTTQGTQGQKNMANDTQECNGGGRGRTRLWETLLDVGNSAG